MGWGLPRDSLAFNSSGPTCSAFPGNVDVLFTGPILCRAVRAGFQPAAWAVRRWEGWEMGISAPLPFPSRRSPPRHPAFNFSSLSPLFS